MLEHKEKRHCCSGWPSKLQKERKTERKRERLNWNWCCCHFFSSQNDEVPFLRVSAGLCYPGESPSPVQWPPHSNACLLHGGLLPHPCGRADHPHVHLLRQGEWLMKKIWKGKRERRGEEERREKVQTAPLGQLLSLLDEASNHCPLKEQWLNGFLVLKWKSGHHTSNPTNVFVMRKPLKWKTNHKNTVQDLNEEHSN